jgi:SEC-C motif-containing protein
MPLMKSTDPCPCGRPQAAAGKGAQPRALPYAGCCSRYLDHADEAAAPDAESLMRSRYTAFVLERGDYLQATWHPSTRPADLDFDPGTKWLGLEVRSHRSTGEDRAEVEFVARYRVGGRAVRLHETSRFVREDGCWFYVDGDIHS